MAHIVPRKEKELLVVGKVLRDGGSNGDAPCGSACVRLSEDFKALCQCAVQALVRFSGVRSFNVACFLPAHRVPSRAAAHEVSQQSDAQSPPGRRLGHIPLGPHTSHAVMRIVDRGDPASKLTDFGAFELYGPSILGGSPHNLMHALDQALSQELRAR